MENHWLIFFTSFTIAFSGALMPGPLFSATISESIRRGASAGPLFILGHGILEMILIAALFLGLAPILKQPMIFRIVTLAGGAFIIFMAVGMFRGIKTLSLKTAGKSPAKGNIILLGAGLSLANPYWIIWWATIGLGYILSAGKIGFTGVVVFFTGHILADLLWYSLVSAGIAKSRKIMSDRAYRILIGVCASFLTVYAIYLISSLLIVK